MTSTEIKRSITLITLEKAQNDWLTQAECKALLECTQASLKTLVLTGKLRYRTLPGHRRYWREDVERLAAPPSDA